jgi:hypothetical protein
MLNSSLATRNFESFAIRRSDIMLRILKISITSVRTAAKSLKESTYRGIPAAISVARKGHKNENDWSWRRGIRPNQINEQLMMVYMSHIEGILFVNFAEKSSDIKNCNFQYNLFLLLVLSFELIVLN